MRFLRLALLLSVIPTLALARGGGGGGGSHGGGGGSHGGGSIGGGGSRGGGSVGGGFRGGGVVGNGFRGNGFVGNGFRGFGSRCCFGGGLYLGFGYGYPYGYGYGYYDPYYYGPSYYDPYYYGAPAAAYPGPVYNGSVYNDSGYVPPSVADAAPTVVNQNINTAPGSYYRAPDYYLIAFTDHTIRAAASYKVEGDQIRYTTREGEERTAPLSTIDRRFSEQINRDRRVDFRLP